MDDRILKCCLIPALTAIAICGPAAIALQDPGAPLVPETFELAEAARSAISAQWLTDEERRDLRIFHGVWDERDQTTPNRRAAVALNAWDINDPALKNPEVPAEVRAEALARAGELQAAIDLLANVRSIRAARIRAEAYETLGEYEKADRAIDEPVELLISRKLEDAESLTEGVRALIVRSRLRGQPSRDYMTMLDLLGEARQQYNRLYWPAMLVEAELLHDKDNSEEAVAALHQVLSLNPRCAAAWHLLGEIALSSFDFDSASQAAENLRRLNPSHPLADLLLAESALIRNDPDRGVELADGLIARWPKLREAHALRCAAAALSYDRDLLEDSLARFDELSPGSARAYYEAGRTLSFDRQYEWAAELLGEAVRRQPNWPAPQIELALLEMQSGRDAIALAALQKVRELDRFNKRVANSLFLLEELLANFRQVETDHFVIRYSPEGQDVIMVDLMAPRLERIHETVAGRFQHEPNRKTVIELMPDHKWFGVRISGMPHIHTIAACTGPVIAMEVPREGPPQRHFGIYDWPRVIQHEYTHTITLSQTANRIPHWLTEAAAVSMEPAPRDYRTARMLAEAHLNDDLFNLDDINWAFIRPRRPGDRSLAYAQGHWMVEFMNERFGESALIRLMEQYFRGEREENAMLSALGVSRQDFYQAFLPWAGEQVKAWGFNPQPPLEDLKDELRGADPELVEQMNANRQTLLDALVRIATDRVGVPADRDDEPIGAENWPDPPRPDVEVSPEQLAAWLEEHPDHPDLVQLAVERALAMNEGQASPEIAAILLRYTNLRPVDPMPHRVLAGFFQENDSPRNAIPHLEFLDVREQYDEVYALALAHIYRNEGETAKAMQKVMRAVNINPYHAPHRELAAAIAIESGDLDLARTHIVALTILEPDRPQHQARLEAIERMIGNEG